MNHIHGSRISGLSLQDFGIDASTGFIPFTTPLHRLPLGWEPWERSLFDFQVSRLQLASSEKLSKHDEAESEKWRARVRQVRQ